MYFTFLNRKVLLRLQDTDVDTEKNKLPLCRTELNPVHPSEGTVEVPEIFSFHHNFV
jgi:hypothetical protein